MKKITNVPDNIERAVKKIKGATAYLLSGSHATGTASKNADWDFFVILKDGMPSQRKTWKIDDEWLEAFCEDQAHIRTDFAEDRVGGRGVTTHMFATGQIIEDDKYKSLEKLQRLAIENWKRGPKPLSKKEKEFIEYDIFSYLQDIEDSLDDGEPQYLLMNHAVNEFVNYYFRLKNKWPLRLKDRQPALEKESPKLGKLIEKFHTANNWHQKAKYAIKMGTELRNEFKLKLNGMLN